MNSREAAAARKAEKSFIKNVKRSFPDIRFTPWQPTKKFVGVIKVAGQKPIALFIKSHQPVAYDELALS